jgi:hypothetical protein
MDPRKDQDVLSWKAPTNVSDVWSVLRLAGYYQSCYLKPDCEASFQEMKN